MTEETKKISKRGGRLPGAGRPKGSTSKLTAANVLDQIKKTCGKPFEELLAEGYALTIIAADMPARQNYEKMILGKVIAEKHEIDHTTLGKAMTNVFTFPTKELPDWEQKKELPVKFTSATK
jgi:hypothetical protein